MDSFDIKLIKNYVPEKKQKKALKKLNLFLKILL